jgi:uncharacterized membrane protein
MKVKKILNFLKQPHIIFIIVALFSGYAFVKLTPPLWGLDEQSHFARVFHIVRGEFISNQDKDNKANTIPDNFFELYEHRTRDILDVIKQDTVLGRQDVTDLTTYEKITQEPFDKSEHFFPFIANYSFLAYPGPIVGVMLSQLLDLNMGDTLLMARLFSLVSYIVIAAIGIWLMRAYKIRWLFLLIALIPTAIFQSSVVTADTMLIGSMLLFFALTYRVVMDKTVSKSILVWFAIFALIIPLLKLNYIFVVIAAILALPVKSIGKKKMAVVYKSILIIGSVLVVAFWSLATNVTSTPEYSQRADGASVIPSDQISFALHNPIAFAAAILRSFINYGDGYYQGLLFTVSGNAITTPLFITILLTIALIGAALVAKEELIRARKLIIYICAGVTVMAVTVFASLYAAFTPVGFPYVDGVQGRYFLPGLLPILMLIALVLPVPSIAPHRKVIIGLLVVSLAALISSIAYVRLALY